jgi:hypothetical protein
MSYTPDAYDDTQPLDSVAAGTAAAEFRTLKTALIDHRDRIEAAETAIDAIEARNVPTVRTALSGSGNWTVPAGVTSVHVRMKGGGRGAVRSYAYPASSAPFRWNMVVHPLEAEVLEFDVAVTPGALIAYAVGANDVLSETFTGGFAGQYLVSASTAAADSTFGSATARKGRIDPHIQYNGQVAPMSATYEDVAEGSLYVPTFPIGNSSGVGGTSQESTARSMTNGQGAYIVLEYKTP